MTNRAEQLLALHDRDDSATDAAETAATADLSGEDGVDHRALVAARRRHHETRLLAFQLAAHTADLLRRARAVRTGKTTADLGNVIKLPFLTDGPPPENNPDDVKPRPLRLV